MTILLSHRFVVPVPAAPEPPEPDDLKVPSGRPNGNSGQTEVAREAYLLYLERGGEHGHDIEDWLRAEQILRARRSTAADLGAHDFDG